VRDRRAEKGHDRVTDELLHGAAVTLEFLAKPRVIRLENSTHVLRIHLLGPRSEADEVGEEDGHDLALLASGYMLRGQGRTAGIAEASLFPILRPALGTGVHQALSASSALPSRM